MHIDHVTFRTGDLAGAKRFLEELFDLEEGARPAAIQRIRGHWLYSEGRPIVHLIATHDGSLGTPGQFAEAIDHVAFARDDYAPFRARLDRLDIAYSTMDLPEIGERRLFLRLPGGPLVEVVFADTMPSSG